MPLKDRSKKRDSGVLLAVSSLPSDYGIGTFGEQAFKFIDFLKNSRQRFWQILPLNPLGEGNSPYKSISCFAGEMLYIDLDFLVRDGLLSPEDIGEYKNCDRVDYNAVRRFKIPLILKAAENFNTNALFFKKFLKENDWWLNDYAVFAAALSVYKTSCIADLPDGIKYRLPHDLKAFEEKHRDKITFYKIVQYIFYSQYFNLKNYAEECGVKIIGDIPFYVSPDSVDVWVNPDDFKVGRDFTPTAVAGVPPDIFSKDGQLWGNPLYNWQNMRKNEFLWWQKRLGFCKSLYDVLRIDHFRAFADYYSIPYGSKTAVNGSWQKGEGVAFWNKIREKIGSINIIAEDLGGEDDPDVKELLRQTDFPNMKILQFGFDGDMQNVFLPQNYNYNSVCYTGTHDNDTALGWYKNAPRKQKAVFNALIKDNDLNVSHRMIRAVSKSPSMLCIVPMQDILCLESSARMNIPGTMSGNWVWRLKKSDINEKNSEILKDLTKERN